MIYAIIGISQRPGLDPKAPLPARLAITSERRVPKQIADAGSLCPCPDPPAGADRLGRGSEAAGSTLLRRRHPWRHHSLDTGWGRTRGGRQTSRRGSRPKSACCLSNCPVAAVQCRRKPIKLAAVACARRKRKSWAGSIRAGGGLNTLGRFPEPIGVCVQDFDFVKGRGILSEQR